MYDRDGSPTQEKRSRTGQPLHPSILKSYPLTSAQRGMLAESLLLRSGGAYVEQIIGESEEPLDAERFRAAWQHAVTTFDALRLSLRFASGTTATQTVAPSVDVPFYIIDLPQSADDSRADRLDEYIHRDRRRGFDLQAVPLMRVSVLRFGGSRWAFVWTIHHTIIDGGSYAVVLRHVFDSYDCLCEGRSLPPAPGPTFAAFLRWLQRRDASAGVRYFKQLLDGVEEATALPLQITRPARQPGESQEVALRFPRADWNLIVEAARETGTSVNVFVQFAWAILLSRYADVDDVVFGATWSGRSKTIPHAELVVGPCINTLPVRVNVRNAADLRQALRMLREQHLATRSFLHTPLQAIIAKQKSDAKQELFHSNVVFEYERFDARLRRKDRRWAARSLRSRSQTNYPLNLSAYFDGDDLVLALEHNVEQYRKEDVRRLLTEYARVLTQLPHRLDSSVADVSLLEPGVYDTLTVHEARREQVGCQLNPLAEILQHGVTRPGAIAITEIEGRSLTYAELASGVHGLAEELRRQGISEGHLIGILLPRSIDAVVSILAVHAVGAAFLLLDCHDAPVRLDYIISDARLSRVLVSAETANLTKAGRELELRVDLIAHNDHRTVPCAVLKPSDLAYVLYTSGSTGSPKGACIPYSALANHIASVIDSFQLSSDDRVLQFASLGFDVALEEILPTLVAGGSLVVRTEAMANTVRAFFETVERAKITVLNLPTAFWRSLVQFDGGGSWPATLRLLIVGGELVAAADLRKFRQANTEHIRFLNGYGPTETTITSTVYDDSDEEALGESVPIGRSLRGHSSFVLDRLMRPVPQGAVGQLYIGGAGLATGYLRQPELTAQRFLRHPFRPGALVYATGDRVRQTERGNLVFVDRIDQQVKIRGFRVELGEIEACLAQHPAVADGAVVLHHPATGIPELRGFVVLRENSLVAAELRSYIAGHLPHYMVPRILIVNALPRTAAGKIDRLALATRQVDFGYQDPSPSPPDRLERELLRIWSDLLETELSDPDTNFFGAGGHSLLMIQMLCEVEMRLDRTCDAEAFLLNPTVKGVARVLRGDGGAIGSGAALLNLARGNPRLRPLFLIPAHSGFRTEYATLAQALHSDIPTYAIQLRPAQTAVDGDAFAEDIRFYVRTIREAEPDGPYALAGYSAGGIVAIAIADALHESGQRVDFVGLIDTAPPSSVEILSPFTSLSRFVRFSRVLASRLGELRDAAARRRILSSLRSAIINTMKHPFSEIPTNVTSDEILESSAGLLTPEEQQIMQRRLNAILSYKLHGNPLEAVLFRTPLDPYFRGPHEPDLAWGRALKRRVVVENVPGPHIRMLKPAGAQRLAKLFERHLLSRSRLSVKILPELLGLSAALVNCV